MYKSNKEYFKSKRYITKSTTYDREVPPSVWESLYFSIVNVNRK